MTFGVSIQRRAQSLRFNRVSSPGWGCWVQMGHQGLPFPASSLNLVTAVPQWPLEVTNLGQKEYLWSLLLVWLCSTSLAVLWNILSLICSRGSQGTRS